ncbi:MAG: peptidoglycan/LPS O-acetylase OafA/YrhL [Bradymonadia bacterium]|jgi:peptidoglycan/LPS O-acetylase OafA/YrhL
MADQTPESRNRYVDLLRAIAITCVVLGHWTIAAIALALGVHPEMVRQGSQISLIPTWFLAVYIVVCLFVPMTLGRGSASACGRSGA